MRQNRSVVEVGIVASDRQRNRYSVVAAVVLFLSSAAVVVWRNRQLTILWDVSYILEHASRIASGDVPYRDFVLPYAPLTFVVQAAIIRIFGRAYWHHVAFATLIGGFASVLAFAIVRRIVDTATSLLLTAPLAILGIYSIVPNPFYDADCCFAILVALLLFMTRENSFAAGAVCVVPLFVKQNIGLAFVAAMLLTFALTRRWRAAAGLAIAGGIAAGLIAAIFGARNYLRWTIEFASARRLPPLANLIDIYNDPQLWWWAACVVLAMFVPRARWAIAIPFLWIELRFFLSDDPTEPEINLLRLWPLFIVAALFAGRLMPLLVIATIQGAFLSQQVWGSTYGIWPLLVILIAFVFQRARPHVVIAGIVAAVMLHHGAWYVVNNRRLTYAKVAEGEMHRGTLAALKGLSMRGEWLPEFEQLVRFTDRNIPREDAILCLPGEDLFYFATGRRPRVPVLLFDSTVNPYSPEQIASMNVQWVIVKERLQINGDPYPDLRKTTDLLHARFAPYARVGCYSLFHRADL